MSPVEQNETAEFISTRFSIRIALLFQFISMLRPRRNFCPAAVKLLFAILRCLAIILSGSSAALAQTPTSGCGSLENAYGPFDYRTEKNDKLKIVEAYHFSPMVESLIRGTTGSVGDDLDYTLRASPNHHRALMAMMRLGEKFASPSPPGVRYSVECYFDRAIRFKPNDIVVRMLYATFLAKYSRMHDAGKQLLQANQLAGENAISHQNIGLIYFDWKDYDKALSQAHKAIALGLIDLPLRDQLKNIGKWIEPATMTERPPAAVDIPALQEK